MVLRGMGRRHDAATMRHRYSQAYLSAKLPPLLRSSREKAGVVLACCGAILFNPWQSWPEPLQARYVPEFLFALALAALASFVLALARRAVRARECTRETV